jgi:tRNA 2-selenouridine synthase SelU
MTITLSGYANPRFLGQQLAQQFPAMAGRTQVICTTDKRAGSRVTILTNAAVIADEVKSFIYKLSAQTVAATITQDAVLTPDQ